MIPLLLRNRLLMSILSSGEDLSMFGDGSDGDVVIAASETWSAPVEDTGLILKNYKSLTVNSGVTVSAGNRNYGMVIRVQGDCVINGTFQNLLSPKTHRTADNVDYSLYPKSMLNTLAGAGGAGGGVTYKSGSTSYSTMNGGAGMAGRFYGGGYGGGGVGGYSSKKGGTGGSAAGITTATTNIFVGGVGVEWTQYSNTGYGKAGSYGGGGSGGGNSYRTSSTNPITGAGGSGPGGAGQRAVTGGSHYYGGDGGGAGNYGGGVIILLVGGNLNISSGARINCNGSAGGAGGQSNNDENCKAGASGYNTQHGGVYGYANGGGGGGGGGGRIFICHKGSITNSGSLTVAGGAGGSGINYGTAGGAGTLAIKTYEQYMLEDI